MQTTIRKWGNSLAVRIPTTFAKELAVSAGTLVEMTVEDGKIILSPIKEPEYTLEELMKAVTKANMHPETDWGAPMGREAW